MPYSLYSPLLAFHLTTIISTNTLSINLESLPSDFFLGSFLYLMMICSFLGIPSGKNSSKLLKPKTSLRIPNFLKSYLCG